MVKGLLKGFRPIIGMNGCHLKSIAGLIRRILMVRFQHKRELHEKHMLNIVEEAKFFSATKFSK